MLSFHDFTGLHTTLYSEHSSIDDMRTALKTAKSKHLAVFNQATHAKKLMFVARVERHSVDQHSNQKHMRELAGHYYGIRVSRALFKE